MASRLDFKLKQKTVWGLVFLSAFLVLLTGVLALFKFYTADSGKEDSVKILGYSSGQIALPKLAQPTPTPYDSDFSLQIPKLNINAPVRKNVDGSNEYNYLPRVLRGIAHYAHKKLPHMTVDGSLPGNGGNIFLFGHSQIPGGDLSDFQGVFNDLHKLEIGDIIYVTFENKLYQYEVYDSTVVNKKAVSYLEATPEETLTLMTCWPLGLDIKRLVVRARPITP